MIGDYLERLAELYLRRRGRVVLSRLFHGFAVGGMATAVETERTPFYNSWTVTFPYSVRETGQVVALCNSMVMFKHDEPATYGTEKRDGAADVQKQ